MKFAIMGTVIAATVIGALPASAEVVVRTGGSGIAVQERHHGWSKDATVAGAIITPNAARSALP